MKVYITYWNMGADGYSEPVSVVSREERAIEWCRTRRNYGLATARCPDAVWVGLDVNDDDDLWMDDYKR